MVFSKERFLPPFVLLSSSLGACVLGMERPHKETTIFFYNKHLPTGFLFSRLCAFCHNAPVPPPPPPDPQDFSPCLNQINCSIVAQLWVPVTGKWHWKLQVWAREYPQKCIFPLSTTHTEKHYFIVLVKKKNLHGKISFKRDAMAARKIPEGPNYTTPPSGSDQREGSNFVVIYLFIY